MTSDMTELQNRLGAESPPIHHLIDPGSIQYFADSIMDPDPRYRIPSTTESDRPSGMVAPPTFFGSAMGLRDIPAGDPRTMSALDLPLPRGWATIATGDEFEFYRPVRSGMTLVSRERFIDFYEKRGRSGRLIFYTLEKTFSTSTGQPVMRRVLYCAAREPIPAIDDGLRDTRVTGSVERDASVPTLTVGPVTVRYLAMFATATAEFVDIHYDADFARSVGLPGPIIQGLYKTALVARMLKDWTGDGALLRSLKVEHRRMDLAGSVLTVGGNFTQRSPGDATDELKCDVWVRNQDGVVTTCGSARVARSIDTKELARQAIPTNDSKEHFPQ